jgi:SAM-dependent methyltransferase
MSAAPEARLVSDRFPRSSKYHPAWVIASASGGANALWLTEWLTDALHLRSDMRVLDLGCGLAMSSVFLRREFGVQVWATDLWFSPSDNLQRIRDANVDDGVFPIHADARSVPFASEFFDAVVCIDSFLMSVPNHLRAWWEPSMGCLHSAAWWRRHWDRTGILEIDIADTLADGWQFWRDWQRIVSPDNTVEIQAVEADRGSYLGYVRLVGRRRLEARLEEPIVSVPSVYTKAPLLRSAE